MTKPGQGASPPDRGPRARDRAARENAAETGIERTADAADGARLTRNGAVALDNSIGKNGQAQDVASEAEAAGDVAAPFAKRPSKRGRRRRRRNRGNGVAAQQDNGAQTNGNEAVADTNAPAPKQAPEGRHNAGKAKANGRGRPASPGTNGRNGPAAPAVANPQRGSTAYAALDLGTNNCRLLVAVPTRPGSFRVVDAFSRIVRLGEGLDATGRLSDAAMDRAVGALKVCRDKLTARPIERTRLIATEACRSADNGAAFLDRVREETGLTLEVVDRATEARLAVAGCGSLIDRDARSTVLFDIGGGSSEIAVINLGEARSRRLADHITAWTSLPVGVVTMAERFGGRHVDEALFAAMTAHAEELLADFAAGEHLPQEVDSAFHLIGTSGTVTTLAGIHLGLERYDRRRVDGLWMRSEEVDTINDQLLSWSFEERVANPCIGRDRADLVLAGCAILQAIRNVWPAERLRVADRGLREGLLTEMMSADGVWRRSRYRRGRQRPRANGSS